MTVLLDVLVIPNLTYVKTSVSRPAYVQSSVSRPAYVKTLVSRHYLRCCPPSGSAFTVRRPDFNDQSTDIKNLLKGEIWCGPPLRWPAPFHLQEEL